MTARTRPSRSTFRLLEAAGDLVADREYEEAQEDGEVRWMGATRVDPGCWDNELDIEVGDLTLPAIDDEDALGDLEADVEVRLGKRVLWTGRYGFWTDRNGRLSLAERVTA